MRLNLLIGDRSVENARGGRTDEAYSFAARQAVEEAMREIIVQLPDATLAPR